MRPGFVATISVLALAAATGVAAAWLHLSRPPQPHSALTVLMDTIGNTSKDPL